MRRLLVILALTVGCSRGDAGHRRPAPVLSPAVAAIAARDAGPPPARTQLGVPACDAYLDELARCIHRMDRAAQPAARKLLDDQRRAWAASARSIDANATLAQACKAAADAARSATSGIGCF